MQVVVLADRQSAPLTDRSVLVFHPGGPGLSATRYLSENPPDVDYSRYVVLAWDGVTAGTGSGACGPKTVDFLTERTPDDFADLATQVGPECEGGFGSEHDIGAWQAADELETIRATLGVSQFDFLGVSYGTAIGEAYLLAYPSHVRRAVLDAPMGLQIPWGDRVRSVEGVLPAAADRLALSCEKPECKQALTGVASVDAYESLRQAVLDRNPMVGSGNVELTPIIFDQFASLALRSESYQSGFAQAVVEALNGDGSTIWRVGERTYLDLDRQAFYTSICADIDRPTQAAEFVAADADPIMFAFASDLAPCAVLPKGVPRPRGLVEPGSEPEVLVVASSTDVVAPATLLNSSPFLASVGRLCITDVPGHTSYADPNVRAALIAFLDGDDLMDEIC